jgi:hypothetical protein
MNTLVINLNSEADVSWHSYLQSTSEFFLSTTHDFTGETYQDALDLANSSQDLLGPFLYGSGKQFDLVFKFEYPDLVPVDLSDNVLDNSILGMLISDSALTPDQISDYLVFFLNGWASAITRCPCYNDSIDDPLQCVGTQSGIWGTIMRSYEADLGGGVNSYLAPCLNPGNTMQISTGVSPFFNVTAQVIRIRNLDRIQFTRVSSALKSCTKTMVITLIGITCPGDGDDYGVKTPFGIDVSMQASVLGENLFANDPKLCDNVAPSEKDQDCPNSPGCVEVFLPASYLQMSIELNLQDGFDYSCAPPKLNKRLKLDTANIQMNFNFTNTPDIQLAGINEDFLLQIETAMLQLSNTSMKSVINNLLVQKITPFLDQFLQSIRFLEIVSFCAEFPVPVIMECGIGPPDLPEKCDLCDDCCLCVTQGDCGEKCRQNCPCVLPFCAGTQRTINSLWWYIFFVICMVLSFTVFVLIRMVKSIG